MKGDDEAFSGDCSGVRTYSDLEELEDVNSPRTRSYGAALISWCG